MSTLVAIFLYNQVEVLDFAGPFEVFHTASRVSQRQSPKSTPPFTVFTLAETARPISARGELTVSPQYAFDHHPKPDVLLIPGGIINEVRKNSTVIDWIGKQAETASITASVCTGAFLLAEAGLLTGRTVTTHWEDMAALRATYPQVTAVEQSRWIDEGSIVTAAGISAGIDMSLHLVERLADLKLAQLTARQMEYDWIKQQED